MLKEEDRRAPGSPPLAAELPAEMVLRTAAACKAALAPLVAGAKAGLVLDGSGVTAIDAAGLQVLLASEAAVRAAGGTLALSRCSGVLLRALTLTGVQGRFGLRAEGAGP